MFAYRQIPILTDHSIRVLALKSRNPKITIFEIAAKTLIPAKDVLSHLKLFRRTKLLRYDLRPLRVVK